jgi:hypothetical protein
MTSRIQELAEKIDMTVDDFVGEMRKRGCSEPTALKDLARRLRTL